MTNNYSLMTRVVTCTYHIVNGIPLTMWGKNINEDPFCELKRRRLMFIVK